MLLLRFELQRARGPDQDRLSVANGIAKDENFKSNTKQTQGVFEAKKPCHCCWLVLSVVKDRRQRSRIPSLPDKFGVKDN